MQETWETRVRSLGQKDPLEEDMATHSSILAWRIPWTEELGGLQLIGSQRVRHDWSNLSLCESDHVQTQLLKTLFRTYWIRSKSLGVVGKSFQESLSNLMNTFRRGQFWHSQNGHPNFLLANLSEILFTGSVLSFHIFREGGLFTAKRAILLWWLSSHAIPLATMDLGAGFWTQVDMVGIQWGVGWGTSRKDFMPLDTLFFLILIVKIFWLC